MDRIDFETNPIGTMDLLKEAIENLQWCGGSNDFSPEGQAKIGYDKGPRTTISKFYELIKK